MLSLLRWSSISRRRLSASSASCWVGPNGVGIPLGFGVGLTRDIVFIMRGTEVITSVFFSPVRKKGARSDFQKILQRAELVKYICLIDIKSKKNRTNPILGSRGTL